MDTTSQPRVTVVMATWNRVDDVSGALDSVRMQTYPNVELIVADGGSTDGTVDILRDADDVVDQLIVGPDDGIYDAWNKALAIATGEWVLFLGSDDRYASKDAIATLMDAAMHRTDANVVVGRAALLHADGTIGARIGTRWSRRLIEMCMSIAHPATATRRDLIDRFGAFSTSIGLAADYDLFLRARKEVRAVNVDDVIVHFSDAGVSSTDRRSTLRSARDVQAQPDGIGRLRASVQYLGFHVSLPVRDRLRARRGRHSNTA